MLFLDSYNWTIRFLMEQRFAGGRVQEQGLIAIEKVFPVLIEVEHLNDRVCDSIEGSSADALSIQPVILDESDDRALVG